MVKQDVALDETRLSEIAAERQFAILCGISARNSRYLVAEAEKQERWRTI